MGLVLFGALLLLGVVGAAVAVAGFVTLSRNLPDPSLLEQIAFPEQSVIYDRTGKTELARFGQFRREVVTWDQIPPVLVDATTAVEDQTFWANAGIDPVGIVKAGLDTIRGRSRGASTITQQLVRQRLLSAGGDAQTQVSVQRKLREIVQSIRLTQEYPGVEGKRRVMTAYLNQNYYGNESYGVQAAAQGYFGVPLAKLTLAQAAIIAAIPKAPSTYDLVQNAQEECIDGTPDDAACTKSRLVVPQDSPIVARRNLVLDLMEKGRTPLTGNRFSQSDFEAAKQEPVVLVSQTPSRWVASQFVWQVRRELTTRLCGQDAETCPVLERGGLAITTTLDLRLQRIAEKWVQAAAVVPKAKDPRAAAKALGLPYQQWMANLQSKDLHNGALVALDYQTGELVAYVGSANADATRATKKFQPRFDVLADGWRQPGSAFKPVLYATGIDTGKVTAATMFMDVVTDFGGGYTPADADGLERGPVRVRDALRFSLNIPAVKALAVTGNDTVQKQAEALGLQFTKARVDAGLSFALGVEEVHPVDLVRAYGALADGGRLADRTTIRKVTDGSGKDVVAEADRPAPTQAIGAGAAYVLTDILQGNTNPDVNPFWGRFGLREGGKRRPATLKTGTNNDARDLNAYGYIAAPGKDDRAKGEYALAVGAWNGNSDNSLVSTAKAPVFSIDVTTYVWQGFLQEATKGWSMNDFARPKDLEGADVDPWTGLRAAGGGPSVSEIFLPGSAPNATLSQDQRCGSGALQTAGFEKDHAAWLKADQAWLDRARGGPGVAGGPRNTRTSYFYNNGFNPYGRSWGPLLGGTAACATPTPTESPSETPSGSPSASPSETPSASPSPTPSVAPTATPAPTAPPTPVATPTRPPPPPTPGPPTAPPPSASAAASPSAPPSGSPSPS